MKTLLGKIFRKLGHIFLHMSRVVLSEKETLYVASTLIETNDDAGRNLYKTQFGDFFWLDPNPKAYVDKCIIETGVFEPNSTSVVKEIVKPGNIVLDIGANIGYYTVLASRLIGESGKVFSFEPMVYYRDVLEKNIKVNSLSNVTIVPFGVSDKKAEYKCIRGDSSATIHFYGEELDSEIIQCNSLDNLCNLFNIDRVDFIKIDVDGHEPNVLHGASAILEAYKPVIILEVAHLNYFKQGTTAWDFYDMLISKKYYIYDEEKLNPIKSLEEFLVKCGNFAYSRNIIISQKSLQ